MSNWTKACTLEGQYVSLVPLSTTHKNDLIEAVSDGDVHKLWYTNIPKPENMATEIERRNALDNMLAFAVIERTTGKAVGMTTYMDIDVQNRRLEIGSTWYRQSVQRTPLNTECKLLLLRHAFETLNCIAVEFRTHYMNQQSRKAIERLGAKFDGVLRAHKIMANGSLRDTAVYSIIASEWPAVKTNLEYRLNK